MVMEKPSLSSRTRLHVSINAEMSRTKGTTGGNADLRVGGVEE